jgi:hypothetical protein
MALSDVATVKAQTGIASADTTKDSWITALLPAAEAAIKQYCGRDFTAAAATEYYTGANVPRLPLKRFPVTSVASVYEARAGFYGTGPDGYGTALTAGVDYALDSEGNASGSKRGVLVRLNGVWHEDGNTLAYGRLVRPQGPAWGNVKVTYTAGECPDDVKYAISLLVQQMMRSAPYGGDVPLREKIGRYEYEFGKQQALGVLHQPFGAITRLLAPYVDVALA